MLNKTVLTLFIIVANLCGVRAQQNLKADSVFALAKQENKNILLIFSGSDWCAQCIRFEKKVLSDPSFIQYADSNLLVLTADFPQAKKLPPQVARQNEELAQKYNPSGKFPLIVLLDADLKVLAQAHYRNESPAEFIGMLNHYQQ